eukprot:8334813-Alexandrium_andersonii.AAC.1
MVGKCEASVVVSGGHGAAGNNSSDSTYTGRVQVQLLQSTHWLTLRMVPKFHGCGCSPSRPAG